MGVEGLCKMFQLRNPQLYVVGAYIHLDEETPHLHLNFVPWVSGSKRGLETKTSLKAALATRGFVSEGKGIPNGSSGQRQRRMILLLLCAGMGLTGRRKTHTISIYPYWIIRSRSEQRK